MEFTKVYDFSKATGAVYINMDHTEFSILFDGVLVIAKASLGLLLFDALNAAKISIDPYVAPIPNSVTPRQARLALLGAGLLDQVETAVKTQDKETQITWEFASEIQRNNPLIVGIGKQLGIASEQIDSLFVMAAGL